MINLRILDLSREIGKLRGTHLALELSQSAFCNAYIVESLADANVIFIQNNIPWNSDCFNRETVNGGGEEYFLDKISESVIDKIRLFQAPLVIDGSTEGGAHWSDASLATLCSELARRQIPTEMVILITANYLQNTIHLPGNLTILHHNSYFTKAIRLISLDTNLKSINIDDKIKNLKQGRIKDFLSTNFTIRPHRVMFASSLIADGIFNNGAISFPDLKNPLGWKNARATLEDLQNIIIKEFDAEAKVIEGLSTLFNSERFCIDSESDNPIALEYQVPWSAAGKTWFSIVTEAEMNSRACCYVTEKSVKPLAYGHPFIILGSVKSLEYIKTLGFLTFSSIIDEYYDQQFDHRQRFNMVRHQIVGLVNKSYQEKAQDLHLVKEIVEANRAHLLNGAEKKIYELWSCPILRAVQYRII